MSHKTLVNGTVYEVGGGKTLIDGVAFAIDKGKTLVGGTAYEVGFGPSMLMITIVIQDRYSCTPRHPEVTIPYNGGTFEVSPESVLTFNFEAGCDDEDKIREAVYVNGTNVYSRSLYGGKTASYAYTITKNATITINCPKYDDGTVTIVEE
jgi:hypothetical protein